MIIHRLQPTRAHLGTPVHKSQHPHIVLVCKQVAQGILGWTRLTELYILILDA